MLVHSSFVFLLLCFLQPGLCGALPFLHLFNVLMFFVDFAINVPVQKQLLTVPRRVLHQ